MTKKMNIILKPGSGVRRVGVARWFQDISFLNAMYFWLKMVSYKIKYSNKQPILNAPEIVIKH